MHRSSSGANQFTWNAKDYASNSRMQEDFGRKHLSALDLAGSEVVLDIGCGDGRLTAEIARRVPGGRVVGVDSSPDMIATARETFGTQHPNLAFKLLSATDLPFRSEFDLVFSTSALHWIKDHLVLLSRIAQSLKPGGRIYLVFGARGTLSGLAPVIERLMEDPDWKDSFQNFDAPFGFYGPEEYRPWLEEMGFAVERLEVIERDVTHQGRGAFEGWLRTTGMPYIHRVDPERQREFLRQIVDAYLEQNPADARGLVHVRMVNLLVTGTKGRS